MSSRVFEAFCISAVNVAYERYRFKKCTQETGDRFDNMATKFGTKTAITRLITRSHGSVRVL